MVIKRALDHYNCEDLCTGMALCLGPGKSEPLSQCEPTGSQLSKSLKTLDDNHNQVIMAENIDKSALDDDEDDGLCTRVTLVKAKSPSQCYREADWIWNMIQNRDQDKYLRMTKSALDRYKALKSLETLDGDHNQGYHKDVDGSHCTFELVIWLLERCSLARLRINQGVQLEVENMVHLKSRKASAKLVPELLLFRIKRTYENPTDIYVLENVDCFYHVSNLFFQ